MRSLLARLAAIVLAWPMIASLSLAAAVEADKPPQPTIVVFELEGTVTERPVDDLFAFGSARPVALVDLVDSLRAAEDDPAVKAVVLTMDGDGLAIGLAQIEELRQAMAMLQAAGKDVVAHTDMLSTGSYALLSGASSITMVPTGDLFLTGLYLETPYLRGLLDKIGVTPDFLTCGDYKSAAESLMRTGPSPEAEEMNNWLLDSMHTTLLGLVASGRGVSLDQAAAWLDHGVYTAERALEAGIIDAVASRQEFLARLKERYGEDVIITRDLGGEEPDLDFSNPMAVFQFFQELMSPEPESDADAVAIVYVSGLISLGEEEPDPFSGGSSGARATSIRRALDRAAEDDRVKAVVLRIDSGGGSATASDIILDATRRVKAKKPLVVSMGNVAGSGGFYVACGADTIIADAATITGSIGVVGGKLVTTDMWGKLGITWYEYERSDNAGILSTAAAFNDAERQLMQGWMTEIYEVFKGHVLAIRAERLTRNIDELAGGRVYTGAQALANGLVDRIGTLDDAIELAATEAGLEEYEVRVIPPPMNPFQILLGEETEEEALAVGQILGQASPLSDAILPLLAQLDPQRAAAVRQAVVKLEMVHDEGAALVMPELVVAY